MAYDDGYYYGQCKIICESTTSSDNGKTVAITDGKNTWSKALSKKVAEFLVPGRARYTVSLLDGTVTKYTNKFDAGYGECIHVMLAEGYDTITRSEFETRVKAVETKATTNATDISSLKTRVTNVENKATTNATNISSVTTKANNNASDITNLKSRVGAAESRISTNETNISNLKSRMTTAENDIVTVRNQASINKSDIATVRTTANQAKNTADSADSRSKTNATNISNLTGRVDNIAGDLEYDGKSFRFGYDKSTGRFGYFKDSAKKTFVPFAEAGAIRKVDLLHCADQTSSTFTITQAHKNDYDVILYGYAPATSGFATNGIGGTELTHANGSNAVAFGAATRFYFKQTKDLTVGSSLVINSQYANTGLIAFGIAF